MDHCDVNVGVISFVIYSFCIRMTLSIWICFLSQTILNIILIVSSFDVFLFGSLFFVSLFTSIKFLSVLLNPFLYSLFQGDRLIIISTSIFNVFIRFMIVLTHQTYVLNSVLQGVLSKQKNFFKN